MEETTTQKALIEISSDDKKREIVNKLLNFFNDDVSVVIDYITDEENPIPVEYITPMKRIDLHPTREYLLRITRILNEIAQLEEKLKEEEEFDLYQEL